MINLINRAQIQYTGTSILLLFFFIGFLPAKGVKPDSLKLPEIQNQKIQDMYNALPEITPAVCMFHASGTSAVPDSLLSSFETAVNRQMVLEGNFKPVSLNKWLISKYANSRAKNIFTLISNLKSERYPVLLDGFCKPYLFKSGSWYVMSISLYPFSLNGFPLTVVRLFSDTSDMDAAVYVCLQDLYRMYKDQKWTNGKTKILVTPFTLDCRKLIGQDTGQFEYIKATFTGQEGVTIKVADDYFSELFSYILDTTGMFNSCALGTVSDYTQVEGTDSSEADYMIKGRIQLTDEINIYYIDLVNTATGKTIQSFQYFSSDFTLAGIWKSFRVLSGMICEAVFGKENYGTVPDISAPGQGFFINGLFSGWDTLESMPLSKGGHLIMAGSYERPDDTISSGDIKSSQGKALDNDGDLIRSYLVYIGARTWLFKGKDGEYVWNLLRK
jgi:hypothetical protein